MEPSPVRDGGEGPFQFPEKMVPQSEPEIHSNDRLDLGLPNLAKFL
jgi:hypothetical protein